LYTLPERYLPALFARLHLINDKLNEHIKQKI